MLLYWKVEGGSGGSATINDIVNTGTLPLIRLGAKGGLSSPRLGDDEIHHQNPTCRFLIAIGKPEESSSRAR